ncbi:hypothetical protein WM40_11720 [Robbsia andropogonis]|uniref:Uncharacterized protein n=1 Tax=Robbsia andropogonis TaxID=28092 RepID=A0A0F5K0D5_9BURK|nr:hypothetical protein [Robbsia andropogonis]KKB63405.1 hypothetical protein WM40_11720 [Robbsia andropogonis]
MYRESENDVVSFARKDGQQDLEAVSHHALIAVDYLNVLIERRVTECVRDLEFGRVDWSR